MNLAVRELVRSRGRFAAVGTALTLIGVLVLLLGGLLDGLIRASTGLVRAQDADLLVYAEDARETIERSVLGADVRDVVLGVDGVAAADGIGVVLTSAAPPGVDPEDLDADLLGVAVVGYERATGPLPDPDPAGAVGDARLDREADVGPGDVLRLTGDVEIPIVGEVDDVAYGGQAGLWVPLDDWRQLVATTRPDLGIGEDEVNVFALHLDDDADPAAVATAVDAATDGATVTIDLDAAVSAIPGVDQQRGVFTAIIGATLLVAGLVVALFFALLTIERTGQYAVLKALGAPTRSLAVGVTSQAGLVALGAAALATALTIGLAAVLPAAIPFQLLAGRTVTAVAAIVLTAVVGSAVTLRRLTRIDPADAIG